MVSAGFSSGLAQVAGGGPLPVRDATPALMLAALLLAAATVLVAFLAIQKRRRDAEVADLARMHRFTRVTDPEEVERLEEVVGRLFGPGPKVTDRLHRRDRGFDVYVERLKIPLYRIDADGNWNDRMQESQERLVVLVSGFEGGLPAFRLMPNSWAMNTVRGKEANLFATVMPFGLRNYVIGRDRAGVARILGGDLQRLLRQNRELTIDGRHDFLAFYLQDRVQPANLPGFVEQATEIAAAIRSRAATAPVGRN